MVVTHVIVSRAEGNVVNLDDVAPSEFASKIAMEFDRDPALVKTVLRETKSIVRMGDGHLIAETKHGFICANAGVDKSNVPGERNVAPLPEDPDLSAERIRQRVRELTGGDVAVLVSDTHGRALRRGEINVAIAMAILVRDIFLGMLFGLLGGLISVRFNKRKKSDRENEITVL